MTYHDNARFAHIRSKRLRSAVIAKTNSPTVEGVVVDAVGESVQKRRRSP